jgi:tRNA A37 threonylcarbamoyladenosine dehydratase
LSINPACIVEENDCFYGPDNADAFDLSSYDYIVDAIDSVKSKLLLIERAKAANVPIISCMGAGNKLDPTRFEVADIYKTSVCPLAKIIRKELRAKGIDSLKVVYSKEEPLVSKEKDAIDENGRPVTGSVAFVPSVAGLILAGEVIKDICEIH